MFSIEFGSTYILSLSLIKPASLLFILLVSEVEFLLSELLQLHKVKLNNLKGYMYKFLLV